MNNLKVKNISIASFSSAFSILAAAVAAWTPMISSAGGLTDFEEMRCIDAALKSGADTAVCVDTELPDCAAPDWFPTDAIGSSLGSSDAMNSGAISSSVRYNEADYSVGSYIRWEHDWYSSVDTPYGPALPSYGHLWNQYQGTTLVKSVSCDVHGTVTYP